MNIIHWIKAETLRDTLSYDLHQLDEDLLGCVSINTVEIREFIGVLSPRDPPLVNFMCIDDNFRARRLAEDLNQSNAWWQFAQNR